MTNNQLAVVMTVGLLELIVFLWFCVWVTSSSSLSKDEFRGAQKLYDRRPVDPRAGGTGSSPKSPFTEEYY